MTLIEFVIANISSDDYYAARFNWDKNTRANIPCPWHHDKRPSLAVSLKNGGAHCHSANCGKRFGNIVHFESVYRGISEEAAARELFGEFVHKLINPTVIKKLSANLLYDEHKLWKLEHDTGISERTAQKFKLGLDVKSRRITFPIQNRFGLYTNIRFYRLPSERRNDEEAPKIYNLKGYGAVDLFPWQSLKSFTPDKPLWWMKAERDTILGIQLGLQCICTTGAGETAFITQWVKDVAAFDVIVVGDNDEGGLKESAKKVATLQDKCKSVYNLSLPFSKDKPDFKDFSDYILKDDGDVAKLYDIWEKRNASRTLKAATTKIKVTPKQKIYSLHAIKENLELKDTKVQTRAIVVGRMDRSYSIPNKFKVWTDSAPASVIEIPPGRELVAMIRMNDDNISRYVKKKILQNPRAKVEPLEFINATEVEISPIVDFTSVGTYLTYKCIHVGNNIETNTPYMLQIVPTTKIESQEQVGIIVEAVPHSLVLDKREYTSEEIASLQAFQTDDAWSGLKEFASEISAQYTKIYNRLDLHIVTLLTYLSPLYFEYPNEGIQRGWINGLVVGDTQTGKSETVAKIQRVFNCGTVVSAENCTLVGLLGGTVKNSGGQFMLRWGRLPINDRQLVVIEELSGLSTFDISRLSDVRSSGCARIDKAGITAETHARTRLLALSNVRGIGRSIGTYPSGVAAISELIGQAEDLSRFDLITTLTDDEVSARIINQKGMDSALFGIYDENLLQLLVRFIWTLKPHQIQITDEAYDATREMTEKLAKIYHPIIPIFKAGSGRLKLARLAVAIACSQFAWDGEKIVVTEDHVDAAKNLLRMLYDKESFGYLRFSKREFAKSEVKDETRAKEKIVNVLRKPERIDRFVHYMLQAESFQDSEINSIIVAPDIEVRRLMGTLLDCNVIKRKGRFWNVTKSGRKWLEREYETNNSH